MDVKSILRSIEKYIKGEEINWRVSVQGCSSGNLVYYVLI